MHSKPPHTRLIIIDTHAHDVSLPKDQGIPNILIQHKLGPLKNPSGELYLLHSPLVPR
jgi:hypothetical protein